MRVKSGILPWAFLYSAAALNPAAPGAHSRASLSVSRSVAQSRTGHFYRSVNEMPGTN
jgi:hypothetical protein